MPLTAGTRLGPYEIVAAIGSGGMGAVYRARDSKLNRHVAIKVLNDRFLDDPGRLRRLQREAQVLAALNHPNVAPIHGLEESDGIRAIVMELVDGEDLAARIARGPIAVDEALLFARQVAEALEAAHDQGIVHRDLKPANIKIRKDGALKVLDFGLAKAMNPDDAFAAADHADSPTITSPPEITAHGLFLGTAAYMSPEQARGKPADKRADIWAFGCVLFEMLSGRPTFPGETISDTVAGILEREPVWDLLPARTPAAVRRLLRRCLEKDPKRRLHDIADARIEIDDVERGASEQAADRRVAAPIAVQRTRRWMPAVVLLALIGAAFLGWTLRRLPIPPEARLEINTAPTTDPSLAISPDGRKIVFVGRSGGQAVLFLRSLDSSSAQPLPGTERGSQPFWSPDNRSIGFFADTKLKRVDIDGSSSRTLATNSAVPIGGTWNADGIILFADHPGGPIFRTSSDGAPRVAATELQPPKQRGHISPKFLPDGRHFLFFVTGSRETHGVYIAELDQPGMKRLFDADTPAVYANGHLLFGREKKLLAQRFSLDRIELVGDPFAVEETLAGGPTLSASVAGPIAYRMLPADAGQRQLVWFDRAGKQIERVTFAEGAAQGPSLSHDGRRVAIYRFREGNMDIWVYETSRHEWERITFDPGDDIYPLWSPDDSSIAFTGFRNAGLSGNVYLRLLSGSSGAEKLVPGTSNGHADDWSADGRYLLVNRVSQTRGPDIWAVSLDGNPKPFEVVATDFNEGLAQFSPDGHWIAYQSDKTGREEIYLRPFPGPGADVRVSPDGGAQVRWNRDGKELFYVAADDWLTAVPIRESSDGKTIEPGQPTPLFVTNVGSTAILKYRQQYAVSPDGRSFVMQSVVGQASSSPIVVMLNWRPVR